MKKFILLYRLPILQVITILVVLLLLGIFVLPLFEGYILVGSGVLLVTGMILSYGVVAKYFRREERKMGIYRNSYHDVFFKGTVVFAILMAILGNFYGLISYLQGGNPFRIIGLLVMVIWIAVFMIYFVWSVYFYNINYGITDEEWEKIFRAKELNEFGLTQNDPGISEPLYNPYRSQTFGLPPGTVRGMIAFTLLLGGISLLISSYGLDYVSNAETALRVKQFEFFETAFLMMIAFYFGDRSLKYLRDRWNVSKGGDTDLQDEEGKGHAGKSDQSKGTVSMLDEVEVEDRSFMLEDQRFALSQEGKDKPLTNLKKALSGGEEEDLLGGTAFVQIMDNTNRKILIDEEIEDALSELQNEKGIKLALPVVKAVISVESSGRGHLPDGRAKILFEGHKFWYWLKKSGKSEEELLELQKEFPNILYPKWTKEHYRLGLGEYKRLKKAKEIYEKAAVYSTSWGLFQILGENLEHNIKSRKYRDYAEFEEKQHEAEFYHFLDFLAFIQAKKVKGKPLIDYISEENKGKYDWASFAYGYNGRGYAVNQYDKRMAEAYEKFKGASA